MQSSVEAVAGFGNSAAGIFQGAYDAARAIRGQLPGAIGDFAFQAANGLIGGVGRNLGRELCSGREV